MSEEERPTIDRTDALEMVTQQLIQAEDERRQVADEEARRTACTDCEKLNKRIAELEAQLERAREALKSGKKLGGYYFSLGSSSPERSCHCAACKEYWIIMDALNAGGEGTNAVAP